VEESFDLAIKEHLELQQRNRMLEPDMPLAHYLEGSANGVNGSTPVLEDTEEWVLPESATVMGHEPLLPPAEELWTGTPAFDWGD
jgi:hypothetical protein